ncbi:MAG: hypothetical protein KC657_18755 [Myxococcales bacterium]|nr:hypothetical protein [Myxococcales bacterium]
MIARRRSLFALALGFGLIAGCFTSVFTPPTFRYTCETDDDCKATVDEDPDAELTQKCIAGLCQYPCTGWILAPVDGECPSDSFGCFNGACATVCDVETNQCSAPQSCLGFGIPDEYAEDFARQLGLTTDELAAKGVCGLACDDPDAPACPGDQLCVEGACIDLSSFSTGTGTTGGSTTGADTDTDTDTGGTQ